LIPYYSTPSGLLDSEEGGSVAICIGRNVYEECASHPSCPAILIENGLQDLQANMECIFVSTPNPPSLNLDRLHGNAQGF
jgi:hypothetical protein